MEEKINKEGLSYLPVGMFFQFFFTVAGGGTFIAGLIVGISVKFDLYLENNLGRISILMIVFGLIFFVIGIFLMIVLYKMTKSTVNEENEDVVDNLED